MTPTEMTKLLTINMQFYPTVAVTKEYVSAWYKEFGYMKPEDFDQVFSIANRKLGRTFPPTPGEVQEAIETRRRSTLRGGPDTFYQPENKEPSTAESRALVEEARRRLREIVEGKFSKEKKI